MTCPGLETENGHPQSNQNLSFQFTGFDPKEPVSLLALFLFSSSRSVCLRGRRFLLLVSDTTFWVQDPQQRVLADTFLLKS